MPDLKDKPFPWKCGKCKAVMVYPRNMPDYSLKVKWDGKHHLVIIPLLKEVPTCLVCKQRWFTNLVDDQITEACKQQIIGYVTTL
jgi:hypothetical protein